MLDIGWSEFLVIGVVALIVIGPRDLPVAMRTAGRYVNRARSMAREFREGLDDIAKEADVKDIQNTISGKFGVEEEQDDWLAAEDLAQEQKTQLPVSKPAPAPAPANAAAPPQQLPENDMQAAAEQAAADAATTRLDPSPKGSGT